MDARFVMAATLNQLEDAKISDAEFWNEINSCKDSRDAIRICVKWQAIADEALASA